MQGWFRIQNPISVIDSMERIKIKPHSHLKRYRESICKNSPTCSFLWTVCLWVEHFWFKPVVLNFPHEATVGISASYFYFDKVMAQLQVPVSVLLVVFEQASLWRATHIWWRTGRIPRRRPPFQYDAGCFQLPPPCLLECQVMPVFSTGALFSLQVLIFQLPEKKWQLGGVGATIFLFPTHFLFSPHHHPLLGVLESL